MMKNLLLILITLILLTNCSITETAKRKEISLNGTWEITRTDTLLKIPTLFKGKVPVPGLVDMADIPMDDQGGMYHGRQLHPASPVRDSAGVYNNTIYWYRKYFKIEGAYNEVIKLKVNKARYHTWVFVNGKPVGENVYCFTPSFFDIKQFLKSPGLENELIIAVGCMNNLPDTVVNGNDFEKSKYIPGIYDDVKIIVSGKPFISNIQTVPDIKEGKVRVVAEIDSKSPDQVHEVSYFIREAKSKKVIAKGITRMKNPTEKVVDFTIAVPGYKLWSPENPFLYDLDLSTTGDNTSARFGMRTFSCSQDSGVVLLNGKPYYMRGTNVCIFRFFEDSLRSNLPWSSSWIIKLHENFKDMHWNSIRYCIGFPPERWYEVADSIGFLIQDEFPLWTGGKKRDKYLVKRLNSDLIANEYIPWMRERWNHACVVIWDAQNESTHLNIGNAINKVRILDLSNRPWENGWQAPASPSDVTEAHPYIFSSYKSKGYKIKEGVLKDNLKQARFPHNGPDQFSPPTDGKHYKNPIIVNEYGWLWLNRDGSTTTLSDSIYAYLFPEADTPEKRLEIYAKNLGMLTEYWRSHRICAGVLHFCGLGHSRPHFPRGQTSDNFRDIKNLEFDPFFYKYVKPAFSPVGLMIDFWDTKLKSGSELKVNINLINDTYEPWDGSVKLSVISGARILNNISIKTNLVALGRRIVSIPVKMPEEKGPYKLIAEITYKGESVKSIREYSIE
jgi:beta-galactosidase